MENQDILSGIDLYKVSVFSLGNKFRRLFWGITWNILCRWTPKPMHGWRIWILRRFGAKIGENNAIYPNSKIWAPWLLKTDDVVTIGPGAEIYNPGGVSLGYRVTISQDAYICGATHDYNSRNFTYIKKHITIEPYVWICAKAIVLPGVHCYEGAILGAASIASKNLESWTVYIGNPAKAVKKRNKIS